MKASHRCRVRLGSTLTIAALACLTVAAPCPGQAAPPQRPPISLYQQPERVNIPQGRKLYSCMWYSDSGLIGSFARPDGNSETEKLDLLTGAIDPLAGLNSGTDPTAFVSPDGKYVLTTTHIDDSPWVVKSLDGKTIETREMVGGLQFPTEAAWMPDSSGWSQAEWKAGSAKVHVYSLASRRSPSDFDYEIYGHPKLVGFIDARHVLLWNGRDVVELYGLGRGAALVRSIRLNIILTEITSIREVSLSLDGKRLCWLLVTIPRPESQFELSPNSGARSAIGRDPINLFEYGSDAVATFWTCPVTGGRPAPVSRIVLDKVVPGQIYPRGEHPDPLNRITPSNVMWSREGDRLIYSLDGEWWSIAVPPDGVQNHG